jgi:cytochrome c peroxidase
MLKKGIITMPIPLFCLILLNGYIIPVNNSNNLMIDQYYEEHLQALQQKLQVLKQSCKQKQPLAILQQQFKNARLSYKKVAVLAEYFNVYETKYLNGPALKRVEEDNPHVIVEPEGFQVVEEKLFGVKHTDYSALTADISNMLQTVDRLINEPDRIYKFREERVFDALRAATLRMITLGISGFDSPIVQYSIPEAASTLQGMQAIIDLYHSEINKKDANLYTKLSQKIAAARQFLLSCRTSFNQFDRLEFITKYANPISNTIVATRLQLGFEMPEERRPVNPDAFNIFDTNAFDVRFFSPNERYQPTPERIELGQRLFHDPILSGTKDRSCGSCHQPQKAFTDGLPKALAIDNETSLSRNTPGLWNTVFQTRQFFDSRTSTLENQLSAVVHNPSEMKGSLEQSIPLLKQHPVYAQLFAQAYANDEDVITQYNIANAIASYIRSLVALNARFDQYMRGDKTKLNTTEKNGFNLFMGKAKCGTCHFMPLFNGLVPTEFTETESEVLGVPATKNKKQSVLDSDVGKFGFTTAAIHHFAFKTPTLRNIVLTAPYMHNGVFATLEEVMEFYNNGGGSGLHIAPKTQTLPADKLNLTAQEIKAVIAFMHALTDTSGRK